VVNTPIECKPRPSYQLICSFTCICKTADVTKFCEENFFRLIFGRNPNGAVLQGRDYCVGNHQHYHYLRQQRNKLEMMMMMMMMMVMMIVCNSTFDILNRYPLALLPHFIALTALLHLLPYTEIPKYDIQ